jgi:hypothetical protein
VNGIGGMIGSMWRVTEAEARRCELGQKAPGPIRLGRPAQALSESVRACVLPHGSSSHFGVSSLYLCHFEVVIPAIKTRGFLA